MTHSCDSITSPCIKHLAIQVIRTKVTTGDCQLSSIATVSIHVPLAEHDRNISYIV